MKQPVYPHLVALTEGTNIPLDKPIVLLGRHQECDIQIPSRKISRRHCCIALVADHLVVRDLGSTNGIRINGVKVVEGNLRPDDELTIGSTSYRVKWGGEADGTLPTSARQSIKADKPLARNHAANDDSGDEPMPLPESGEPSKARKDVAKHGSLEIPEDVGLAPLDPLR